ncbi:ACP S-malonyltransferase [Aquimarina aquimarini]|uniref:ACP S-malonyltransferase n=1 Tax=Aquimarina aquimarini TaxID=1191734 RepID=UPI001F1CD9DC|nr:ACP S-malonyltransferase [Aquimarina aquimarini]
MKKAFLFPGQGSQYKGMGQDLFGLFPEQVSIADDILGYSIQDLCLNDPLVKLQETEYTQPAIYVVSVLAYLKEKKEGNIPNFVAGHSLGEYSALFAAKVFDFATGLKLVQERGRLMSQARNGGMAAILGLQKEEIEQILRENGLENQITIANYNTPSQIVVSGQKEEIIQAQSIFEDVDNCRAYILLRVSGAFHSNLMKDAANSFEYYLQQFSFAEPEISVIANTTARVYKADVKTTLCDQITNPVQWNDTIRYMMGAGITDFYEIGPGTILTGLTTKIKSQSSPLVIKDDKKGSHQQIRESNNKITKTHGLGDESFKKDYKVKYAYVTGGMAHGIASKELVVAMAKSGFLSFFGTGGLPLSEVENAIVYLKEVLGEKHPYGMNLVHSPLESQTIQLYLDHDVKVVEVSAYIQASKALVLYRLKGLEEKENGQVICKNKIIAKISRPEVAKQFLLSPPQNLVNQLLEEGVITSQQAHLSQFVSLADDLCVEADSGGHTDQRSAFTVLPAIMSLREELKEEVKYPDYIRIGLGGGIGTPESATAAFMLGADFILTGSINQCTVEAGTSEVVKELLATMNVQDTGYSPAGDMFELGSKVQVLKKGVFFPARANKLYELYRRYNSIDELDEKTKKLLEEKYFKKGLSEVYEEVKIYHREHELNFEAKSEKQKMASIFKWYFSRSSRLALEGDKNHIVDFQIWCGPALGAFNQWVKGTRFENWKERYVSEIAVLLMEETTELLEKRIKKIKKQLESVV